MDIPREAREEVEDLSIDELEFIERELFYAYNTSYEAYYKDGMDNLEELAAYERALETIGKVRKIKQALDEQKIESAKEFHSMLDNE